MNEDIRFIRTYLQEQRSELNLPGLAAGVVRGGKPLLVEAWGYARLSRMDPFGVRTRFRIGSITKVFTGILLLQAVQKGLLCLDDSLSSILPEFAELDPQGEIRLIHLATHSSGLPMMPPLPELEMGFERPTLEDLRRIRFPDVGRILAAVKDTRLEFPPGQGQNYSNFGAVVLAEALCRVTRVEFRDALAAQIFDPLGMTDSLIPDAPGPLPGQACGYFAFDDRLAALPDYDIAGFAPAGGIFSSIQDLTRFLAWVVSPDPEPLLSLDMRDRMAAEQFALQDSRYGLDSNSAMGVSWFLGELNGQVVLEHGGADMSYVAFLAAAPATGAGVCVAMNTGQAPDAAADLTHRVLELLLR